MALFKNMKPAMQQEMVYGIDPAHGKDAQVFTNYLSPPFTVLGKTTLMSSEIKEKAAEIAKAIAEIDFKKVEHKVTANTMANTEKVFDPLGPEPSVKEIITKAIKEATNEKPEPTHKPMIIKLSTNKAKGKTKGKKP